ncbi:MAG: DUF190 domain-containing protein [Verrucomicrobiota bacterium]
MHLPPESQLLRIFIGESDRHDGQPLYEAIVLAARTLGLAGATVMRASMGYGAASRLHTAKILRLSADLPMVVEIVDSEDKIHAFLPTLEAMLDGGLVTLQPVQVIQYQHGRKV